MSLEKGHDQYLQGDFELRPKDQIIITDTNLAVIRHKPLRARYFGGSDSEEEELRDKWFFFEDMTEDQLEELIQELSFSLRDRLSSNNGEAYES